MNMTTTRERMGQSRWAGWVGMMLVTAVSGCAGGPPALRAPPLKTETEPVFSATAAATAASTECPGGPTCGIQRSFLTEISDAPPTNCPTGNCDPGGTGNAKGIYTAEGGNHCFESFGQRYVCPEAFFNTPSGLEVEFRLLDSPRTIVRRRVRVVLDPRQHGGWRRAVAS